MTPQAREWIDESKNLTFYDINNGYSRPMTAAQVFEQVTGNPCYYDDSVDSDGSEEPFFYTTFLGEDLSYSVKELCDIFGIDLEQA